MTAIEIGKALGARVLAAASTDEKLELAKRHGADAVFNYTQDTIKAKVMEFTGDRGIDVAYDPVGADYAEQVVRSMAWNGRYLVIGFAGGKIPAIPLNLRAAERLLAGRRVLGRAHAARAGGARCESARRCSSCSRRARSSPHVTELDGLERFTEALDVLNGRRSTGKVVIRVAAGRIDLRIDGLRARARQRPSPARTKSARDTARRAARVLCALNVQVRLR